MKKLDERDSLLAKRGRRNHGSYLDSLARNGSVTYFIGRRAVRDTAIGEGIKIYSVFARCTCA
jgi:hypothetical protein